MRRRALLCAVVLSACDTPAPVAPEIDPGMVLFSVLDPGSVEQVVLLMRSRESVPDTAGLTIVQADPIVSAGEIPVTNARVVLYGSTGDSAVAVEDRVSRTDRLGAGVYRFYTGVAPGFAPPGAHIQLVAGRTYRLRVTSTLGTAEGSTRLPTAERIVNSTTTRSVNLTRDSVLLGTTATASGGFVYSLRGSNGTTLEGDPQFRRDLERRLVLPSGDAWAFSYARDRLRTGTRHVLTVTAADTNYFEYYGSQGDPFADRTQRTTLRGAAGVFGSVLVVATVPILVTQTP